MKIVSRACFVLSLFMWSLVLGMGSKPPDKVPDIVTLPQAAPVYVEIKILKLTGYSPKQEVRYRKVIFRVEEVINSEIFKAKVLGFQHKGKAHFFDTPDSNQTVLTKILSKHWPLDSRLEYMRKGTSTIGYTYSSVQWLALNARKFDYLSDKELASNLIHELGSHKVGGYQHSKYNDSNRPFSAPYGLGSIVAGLF